MPNYKLSPTIIENMKTTGTMYAERRYNHTRTGFPLTYDQLQATMLPAKWRNTIMEMKTEGVITLETSKNFYIAVVYDDIPRPPVLRVLALTEPLLVCSPVFDNYYAIRWFMAGDPKADGMVLDLSVLTSETRVALVEWVNRTVAERRLANLASRTIGSFLNSAEHARSVAHVVARWPALAMLVAADQTWRVRFSNPPNNLKPYQWSEHDRLHGWYAKHYKAMKLAELVLTSASMLPEKIDDPAPLAALVIAWRALPGDTG